MRPFGGSFWADSQSTSHERLQVLPVYHSADYQLLEVRSNSKTRVHDTCPRSPRSNYWQLLTAQASSSLKDISYGALGVRPVFKRVRAIVGLTEKLISFCSLRMHLISFPLLLRGTTPLYTSPGAVKPDSLLRSRSPVQVAAGPQLPQRAELIDISCETITQKRLRHH
ncbi:hypothetical protein BDR04DRAFT_198258 [Suillus decipiens]|nr:hypothetical protein BDR04DRAFT_198258 [Suillus decipiens]